MRFLSTLFLTALASVLTACGGGGGGAGPAPNAPQVKAIGNVFALNGQSAQVSGVRIDVPQTGAAAVSGADGTFDLGFVPPTLITLRVTPPGGTPLRTAMVMSSEVEVDLSDTAEVEIHLSVNDDSVDEVSVDRCRGSGSDNDTISAMTVASGTGKGKLKVRVRDDGGTGFDVEVEHLPAGASVQVHVIDPAMSNSESQGTLTTDALGEAELELRTNDGDRLPFGVADVSQLEGFQVEVRDGALVLMRGIVPAVGSAPTCTPSGGGGGNAGRARGEAILTNAAGVSGSAQVELRSRPARGEERIEIEVSGTSVSGTIEVWIEDPSNAGVLTPVGVLQAAGTILEYERDTDSGDTLPYGVSNAAALVGLSVELRRQSDASVVYSGTTPPLNRS